MSFTVSRRSALAGAGCLGGLVLAGGQGQAAVAAASAWPPAPPAAGGPETLAIWTRISLRGGDARITLVRLDAQSRPTSVLAEQAIPTARIRSVAALHREGREFARVHVAHAWGTLPAECRVEHAAISDGHRHVRLIEWADYV